jgi:hypothetical protein
VSLGIKGIKELCDTRDTHLTHFFHYQQKQWLYGYHPFVAAMTPQASTEFGPGLDRVILETMYKHYRSQEINAPDVKVHSNSLSNVLPCCR